MADTDFVEWILLDSDLVTRLSILPVLSSHLYMEHQEPGSGELTIPLDTTAAGLVENGQFAQCWYRGAARGGFLIDNIKITDADRGEYGGRVLSVSGRGPLALLDEAIVWQDGSGATERDYTAQTKAAILIDQITEAKARGALSVLSYDFTSTSDSTGVTWTDDEDLSFPVGTTLLDMVRQFGKSGDMEFSISLSSTDFVLSAYKNGTGSDKTETIFFRIGSNCMDTGSDERGDAIRNVYLTKFKDGYTTVSSSDSIAARRRREKFISLEVAQSADSANTYASAKLDQDNAPHKSINIRAYDGVGPRLFLDYNLGDTVTLDKFGTEVTFRILGIQIDFSGPEFASVTLEMNYIMREPDDLDWLMKQWVTAHDADLAEVRAWLTIGQPNGEVYALHYYGGYLYVGGDFTGIAGALNTTNIARYNVSTGVWSALDAGITFAKVIAITDVGGTIFAATPTRVYQWGGSSWTLQGTATGTIYCMSAYNSNLYVGGAITTIGGLPNLGGYNVVKWDGASWSGPGLYLGGANECVTLTVFDSDLFGGFNSSTDTKTLQRYDGSSWTTPLTVVTGVNGGTVTALAATNSSLAFVTGSGSIRLWDGASTSASVIGDSTGYGNEGDGVHDALASYLSDIYYGAQYTGIDSTSGFNNIGKYSGGIWSKLSTGMSTATPAGHNDRINSLAMVNTDVYAGGLFTTAGGKSIQNLAVWVTDFQSLIEHLSNGGSFDMAGAIHTASTSGLTDNDEFPFWEDTSQALRKLTWADLKSAAQTYFDGVYLRLDVTNDPLTDQLQIINSTSDAGGIYVQTLGDAFTADFEQYTGNTAITSPTLFLYRSSTGTGNITSPMLEAWQDATGSGTITGDWVHFQQNSTDIFSVEADGSVWSRGYFKPNTHSDSDAPNSSIYFSSTANRLVFKDGGGVVNNLY